MKRDTHKITMTPAQREWMRAHFKHTKNDEIVARFGWSHSTMHRFARELGLTKTPQYMRKCQEHTTACAVASHLKNGTYPPKGYIIPKSEQFRFKPGRKESEATKRKRLAQAAATRRQTIKEERARISFGIPQRTKLRLIAQPRIAIMQRLYLRKHGYHIERGSLVAYYDDQTVRCPKIEARTRGDRNYVAFQFLQKPSKNFL